MRSKPNVNDVDELRQVTNPFFDVSEETFGINTSDILMNDEIWLGYDEAMLLNMTGVNDEKHADTENVIDDNKDINTIEKCRYESCFSGPVLQLSTDKRIHYASPKFMYFWNRSNPLLHIHGHIEPFDLFTQNELPLEKIETSMCHLYANNGRARFDLRNHWMSEIQILRANGKIKSDEWLYVRGNELGTHQPIIQQRQFRVRLITEKALPTEFPYDFEYIIMAMKYVAHFYTQGSTIIPIGISSVIEGIESFFIMCDKMFKSEEDQQGFKLIYILIELLLRKCIVPEVRYGEFTHDMSEFAEHSRHDLCHPTENFNVARYRGILINILFVSILHVKFFNNATYYKTLDLLVEHIYNKLDFYPFFFPKTDVHFSLQKGFEVQERNLVFILQSTLFDNNWKTRNLVCTEARLLDPYHKRVGEYQSVVGVVSQYDPHLKIILQDFQSFITYYVRDEKRIPPTHPLYYHCPGDMKKLIEPNVIAGSIFRAVSNYSHNLVNTATGEHANPNFILSISIEYFMKLYQVVPELIGSSNWFKVWFVCYILAFKYCSDETFKLIHKGGDFIKIYLCGQEDYKTFLIAERAICIYLEHRFFSCACIEIE